MVVLLMEEFGGLSLKRKAGDEPDLFGVGGDDRYGSPLSCRATKTRRLACPGGQHRRQDADGPAVSGGGVEAMEQADLKVGDAAPSSAAEEVKAMVLYGGGGGPSDAALTAPRLRPCGVQVRAGADWVRAMLREADSRTVRGLLAGAHEQGSDDLALAVVPWVPTSPAEESGPSATEEEEDDAAAMDVEEDEGQAVHHWTRETAFGSSAGYMYWWQQQQQQQHCMVPLPQLPEVGQASPVLWS